MGSDIRSCEDLVAWRMAVEVAESIYAASGSFPADERFGLTQQVRRAAVSIASNIAEGFGRGASQDFARFLRVARGSLYEVETQLVIATRLGYLAPERHELLRSELEECGRVLAGLLKSVQNRAHTS